MSDQVKADRPALDQALLSIVGKHGGRRGEQVLALLAAGQVVAPFVKWGVERKRKLRGDFTITVEGTDDIYPELQEWVLARMPAQDRKAMIASTGENRLTGVLVEGDGKREVPRVRLRYDGQRTQTISIDGHRVQVTVTQEKVPGLSSQWVQVLERIIFAAGSAEARDAVVRTIDELLQAKHAEPGPPPLLMPSRWGGSWNRRRDLPPRTLDSVVLKDGQLDGLVGDLRRFLAAEDEYNRHCQPWHRGYLFHGTPGTGKTSVARALANHFGLPTYYLPLGDLSADADLMGLVGAIEPRSVLLLEDIDVFHASKDRSETDKTSVAGMLNALDGVWTPHGLVTIMTTNERGSLDPALIRAGRIDVDMEFTPLDHRQAGQLAALFEVEIDPGEFDGQSPASLIEALRRTQPTEGVKT
jgi:hypothetical protein